MGAGVEGGRSRGQGVEGEGGYELGDLARNFRGGGQAPGISPGSSVSDVDQEEPRFGAVATVSCATGEGFHPHWAQSMVCWDQAAGESAAAAAQSQAQRLVIGKQQRPRLRATTGRCRLRAGSRTEGGGVGQRGGSGRQ